MTITEVRITLADDASAGNERLGAYVSIVIDNAFVVRDLKVIDGFGGAFVAMPSRKLTDRCRNCGAKNHLLARFCNDCGCRLDEGRAPLGDDGRPKLHSDIAHPINVVCRRVIQDTVLAAYDEKVRRSRARGGRASA